MKKRIMLFITSLLIFITSCHSQNEEKQIVSMIKEFYIAYNTVHVETGLNELKSRLDSLQQIYCTKRFRNELKVQFDIHGLDHDILINDVYSEDIESLKAMTITKDDTKENTYLVSYNAVLTGLDYKKTNQKVQIYVVIVKEDGQYRIDNVLDI